MTNLVLWDMDGTLCNDSQRQHLYQAQQYAEYFSYDAQMADPQYEQARALYEELLAAGWTPGYLTARLERNRAATVDWLTLHGYANPETAILRPDRFVSVRPPQFKSDILGALKNKGEYDKIVLVDNDPLVIELVTKEHGAEFCFHADWDLNPETASMHILGEDVVLVPEKV